MREILNGTLILVLIINIIEVWIYSVDIFNDLYVNIHTLDLWICSTNLGFFMVWRNLNPD